MNEAGRDDDNVTRRADDELSTLRERFELMDEIDRRNSDMFERFAAALRGSAEVRAKATLDISATLSAIEAKFERERQTQQETLALLHEEIVSARERMGDLVASLTSLGSHVSALTARADPHSAGASASQQPSDPVPAAPLPPSQAWTIVFHDVPDPSSAMSLQSHLASRPGVIAALHQAFEYGEARFDVRTRRDLSPEDVTSWPDGDVRVIDQGDRELHAAVVTDPNRAHDGEPS